ncbi:hypothetical protein SCAR479_08349 [Seiridium cardinale]|uniref:Uncharacterized protein n=1 Tax=Seiridium cardinale TaxID=138064 RepID=A0ABR2XN91_9PEZI
MDKKKFMFQLDTPYSATTLEDQDTILELLCTLLSPIGHHRLRYIKPSKGKREKKRKRKEAANGDVQTVTPPAPEIGTFVDVGLSAVTRFLQSESAETGKEAKDKSQDLNCQESSQGTASSAPYSAVFIARSGQPSILNSHLPQLIAVASRKNPSSEPIRLVGFSKACQDRLSEALGIPRVSVIGLRHNAPNSKVLVDYTRQHVPVIDIAWFKESQDPQFKDTKINTIETVIGKRQKGKRGFGVEQST